MPGVGDRDAKQLYRIGGLSGVALGLGYLGIIGIYVPMGAPPEGAGERLAYLAAHTAAWWWILGLSVLTDLLFVPLGLALYVALKEVSRSAMLLATACLALFVFLDLAVTWTNYAVLIALSSKHAAEASPAGRAAIEASAEYSTIVLESRLLFVYNSLTAGVGTLLAGLVMLKGGFGKIPAWLGIGAGGLAAIAVVGSFFVKSMNASIVLASLLTTMWAFAAGYRLYRLGRE